MTPTSLFSLVRHPSALVATTCATLFTGCRSAADVLRATGGAPGRAWQRRVLRGRRRCERPRVDRRRRVRSRLGLVATRRCRGRAAAAATVAAATGAVDATTATVAAVDAPAPTACRGPRGRVRRLRRDGPPLPLGRGGVRGASRDPNPSFAPCVDTRASHGPGVHRRTRARAATPRRSIRASSTTAPAEAMRPRASHATRRRHARPRRHRLQR